MINKYSIMVSEDTFDGEYNHMLPPVFDTEMDAIAALQVAYGVNYNESKAKRVTLNSDTLSFFDENDNLYKQFVIVRLS